MTENLTPMSTWTPKDGQTYEIVDAEARERITDLEDGTVKSVNSIEPDANGNVTLPVPSKTSDLTNDSGFITASQVPAAPVQSVNSKTGAVVLSASDVGAMPSSYVAPVTSVNGQTGDVVIQGGGGGAVDSVNGKTGVVVLDAEDVGALPDDTVIPPAVTESTVSGWGFTKNTGTYSKPSGGIPDSDIASAATWNAKGTYSKPTGGIPASDMASAVQTSLGKADMAVLFSESQTLDGTQQWRARRNIGAGTYSKPSGGIPSSDLDSDVQTSLGKADTALQSHQSLAAYRTSAAQDTIDAGKLGISENAYRSASIPMGELDSTSTATVMTATVPGITELRDGVCMWLRNGVVTSASGFTININNLGAKPCYSSLAAESRSTTIFNVNYALLMIYNSTRVNGGCWDIVYGVDTNTTYTPPKLGFGYGTCTTAAATAAKTASISSYALTTGGIVSIKFENDVPANATLNITSKGAKAIYHRGAAIAADVIKAGDTATFVYSTYYHLISIDRDETADLTNYQTKAITDTGGYFTTDTVDGALQEIGAELAGINTLIGSGVIS